MRDPLKHYVPLVIMLLAGWFTLLTYLVPAFARGRDLLVEWAIIIAAFAVFLGFINVFFVHATRIARWQGRSFYSLVLLVCMIAVAVASFGDASKSWLNQAPTEEITRQGISGVVMTRVYEYVLIPIQASLAALLPFLLGFAAFRTLKVRAARGTASAAVFLITAIVVLSGQVPLLNLTLLRTVRDWIVNVPAMAGMRGILLGVALGITATALRVLIGVDRPTSD